MSPLILTVSIRSFMRLMQRRSVDLPQPLGPMMAVTLLRGNRMLMLNRACLGPYQRLKFSTSTIGSSASTALWMTESNVAPLAIASSRLPGLSGGLAGGFGSAAEEMSLIAIGNRAGILSSQCIVIHAPRRGELGEFL